MKKIKIDDSDLKREIILSHYESPVNKVDDNFGKKNKDMVIGKQSSTSCIDNITCYLKYHKQKIVDAKFSGVACAISTSSTDLMCQYLCGLNKKNALKLIDEYIDMIDHKKAPSKELKNLLVFADIYKQPNRINCAKIGILALKDAIK